MGHENRTIYGEKNSYSIEEILNRKSTGLGEILVEVWKNFADYATLFLSKARYKKRRKVASSLSSRNATSESNYRGIILKAIAA